MRCALVLLLSLFVPVMIKIIIEPSFLISILNIGLTVISTTVLCIAFGLETEERLKMKKKVRELLVKMKSKKIKK